jgi:hypothetical protein
VAWDSPAAASVLIDREPASLSWDSLHRAALPPGAVVLRQGSAAGFVQEGSKNSSLRAELNNFFIFFHYAISGPVAVDLHPGPTRGKQRAVPSETVARPPGPPRAARGTRGQPSAAAGAGREGDSRLLLGEETDQLSKGSKMYRLDEKKTIRPRCSDRRPKTASTRGAGTRTPYMGYWAAALLLVVALLRTSSAAPDAADAGTWSDWTPAAGPTTLSPSLADNPVAGLLELVFVGMDGAVQHTRVTGDSASDAVPTGLSTTLPPAIVVASDGVAHLLAVGSDGAVQHSRFVDDAWTPAVSTKATTALPPAAAINSTGDTLELITVGTDGGVRHSRFVSNAWKSPTLL